MAVRIRLIRRGRTKRPFYSVVAADSKKTSAGSYIEKLGTLDTLQDPPKADLKVERIEYWLSVGAQPSETVANLIKREGIGASAEA
jgi:small subunit ribosomal protein S16